jgi:hypothetical protein
MQSPAAVATLKEIATGRLQHSEESQDLLEYGVLAALVALVALGAVTTVGTSLGGFLWNAIAASF